MKLSKSSLHNTSNNVGSKSENATMHIFPEGEFRGSFYTSNSKFSETLRSSRGWGEKGGGNKNSRSLN